MSFPRCKKYGIDNTNSICRRCNSIEQKGFMDEKDRPMDINTWCSDSGIGLNASLTLSLILNLPLIFGDFVPEGDRPWHVLILLLHHLHCISSTYLRGIDSISKSSYWRILSVIYRFVSSKYFDPITSRHGTISWVYMQNWSFITWLEYEVWCQTQIL